MVLKAFRGRLTILFQYNLIPWRSTDITLCRHSGRQTNFLGLLEVGCYFKMDYIMTEEGEHHHGYMVHLHYLIFDPLQVINVIVSLWR